MKMNHVERLLKDLLSMAKGITIKRSYLASQFETLESIRNADYYKLARSGKDKFESYILYEKHILEAAGLTPEDVNLGYLSKNNIPLEFRENVLRLKRKFVIDSYIEENEYYRELHGLRPFSDNDNIYLEDEIAGVDFRKPIHDMNDYEVSILEQKGIIEELVLKYPKKKYLKYMGSKKVDIMKAREAGDYDIIKIGKVTNNNHRDMFLKTYEFAKRFILNSEAYQPEVYGGQDEYESYIGFLILSKTISLCLDNNIDILTHKKYSDELTVKYILQSYALDVFDDIPVRFRKIIADNIETLIHHRGTDQVFKEIYKIFGFDDVEVFKYYIVKKYNNYIGEALTDKKTQDPPNPPVVLSVTYNSCTIGSLPNTEVIIEHNGTPVIEWSTVPLTVNSLLSNTQYSIYARYMGTYKLFPSKKSTAVVITTPEFISDDPTNAPGPKMLLHGNINCGFFGVVDDSELISGTELASLVGLEYSKFSIWKLPEGIAPNNAVINTTNSTSTKWLKFAWKGKIIFKKLGTIGKPTTYEELSKKGLLGDLVINVKNIGYRVDSMDIFNPDKFDSSFYDKALRLKGVSDKYLQNYSSAGWMDIISYVTAKMYNTSIGTDMLYNINEEYNNTTRAHLSSMWANLMLPLMDGSIEKLWYYDENNWDENPEFLLYSIIPQWSHEFGTGTNKMFSREDIFGRSISSSGEDFYRSILFKNKLSTIKCLNSAQREEFVDFTVVNGHTGINMIINKDNCSIEEVVEGGEDITGAMHGFNPTWWSPILVYESDTFETAPKYLDKTNSPGPKTLLHGDCMAGFFGEVDHSSLFTAKQLLVSVGFDWDEWNLYLNGKWLKFMWENRVCFIPKIKITDIPYERLDRVGCARDNERCITSANGDNYFVSLMSGAIQGEGDTRLRSFINKLIYPLLENPPSTDTPIPNWSHSFGSGISGKYMLESDISWFTRYNSEQPAMLHVVNMLEENGVVNYNTICTRGNDLDLNRFNMLTEQEKIQSRIGWVPVLYYANNYVAPDDTTEAPGRKYLIGGSKLFGFFGEVESSEVTSNFGTNIGFPSNLCINGYVPWLKFSLYNQIIFIPKKSQVINFNVIDNHTLLRGSRVENFNDNDYRIFAPMAADISLMAHNNLYSGHSMWNNLIRPIIQTPTSFFEPSGAVIIPELVREWKHPYNLNGLYTQEELNLLYDEPGGTIATSFVYVIEDYNSNQNYVARGGSDFSGVLNNQSTVLCSYRPVLLYEGPHYNLDKSDAPGDKECIQGNMNGAFFGEVNYSDVIDVMGTNMIISGENWQTLQCDKWLKFMWNSRIIYIAKTPILKLPTHQKDISRLYGDGTTVLINHMTNDEYRLELPSVSVEDPYDELNHDNMKMSMVYNLLLRVIGDFDSVIKSEYSQFIDQSLTGFTHSLGSMPTGYSFLDLGFEDSNGNSLYSIARGLTKTTSDIRVFCGPENNSPDYFELSDMYWRPVLVYQGKHIPKYIDLCEYPGPAYLKSGNSYDGFFGEVNSRDLINTQAFLDKTGFNNGVYSIYTEYPVWLKLLYNNKIAYFPKTPLIYNLSYNDLLQNGMFGKPITLQSPLGEIKANVNTLSSLGYSWNLSNPVDFINSVSISEWNRVIGPIMSEYKYLSIPNRDVAVFGKRNMDNHVQNYYGTGLFGYRLSDLFNPISQCDRQFNILTSSTYLSNNTVTRVGPTTNSLGSVNNIILKTHRLDNAYMPILIMEDSASGIIKEELIDLRLYRKMFDYLSFSVSDNNGTLEAKITNFYPRGPENDLPEMRDIIVPATISPGIYVKTIGQSAFKNKNLRSIYIPYTEGILTTIEDEAFADNPDVNTTVNLPDYGLTLMNAVFKNTPISGFTSISIGLEEGVSEIFNIPENSESGLYDIQVRFESNSIYGPFLNNQKYLNSIVFRIKHRDQQTIYKLGDRLDNLKSVIFTSEDETSIILTSGCFGTSLSSIYTGCENISFSLTDIPDAINLQQFCNVLNGTGMYVRNINTNMWSKVGSDDGGGAKSLSFIENIDIYDELTGESVNEIPPVVIPTTDHPGPKTLIAGDMNYGFFGEVSASELDSPISLLPRLELHGDQSYTNVLGWKGGPIMAGLIDGNVEQTNLYIGRFEIPKYPHVHDSSLVNKWLKFAINGKIMYRAKYPLILNPDIRDLESKGLMSNNKDIKLGNHNFKIGVSASPNTGKEIDSLVKDYSEFGSKLTADIAKYIINRIMKPSTLNMYTEESSLIESVHNDSEVAEFINSRTMFAMNIYSFMQNKPCSYSYNTNDGYFVTKEYDPQLYNGPSIYKIYKITSTAIQSLYTINKSDLINGLDLFGSSVDVVPHVQKIEGGERVFLIFYVMGNTENIMLGIISFTNINGVVSNIYYSKDLINPYYNYYISDIRKITVNKVYAVESTIKLEISVDNENQYEYPYIYVTHTIDTTDVNPTTYTESIVPVSISNRNISTDNINHIFFNGPRTESRLNIRYDGTSRSIIKITNNAYTSNTVIAPESEEYLNIAKFYSLVVDTTYEEGLTPSATEVGFKGNMRYNDQIVDILCYRHPWRNEILVTLMLPDNTVKVFSGPLNDLPPVYSDSMNLPVIYPIGVYASDNNKLIMINKLSYHGPVASAPPPGIGNMTDLTSTIYIINNITLSTDSNTLTVNSYYKQSQNDAINPAHIELMEYESGALLKVTKIGDVLQFLVLPKRLDLTSEYAPVTMAYLPYLLVNVDYNTVTNDISWDITKRPYMLYHENGKITTKKMYTSADLYFGSDGDYNPITYMISLSNNPEQFFSPNQETDVNLTNDYELGTLSEYIKFNSIQDLTSYKINLTPFNTMLANMGGGGGEPSPKAEADGLPETPQYLYLTKGGISLETIRNNLTLRTPRQEEVYKYLPVSSNIGFSFRMLPDSYVQYIELLVEFILGKLNPSTPPQEMSITEDYPKLEADDIWVTYDQESYATLPVIGWYPVLYYESGTTPPEPPEPSNDNLYMAVVNANSDTVYKDVLNPDNFEDYDRITIKDPLWGVYQNKEDIKNILDQRDFNYLYSKYIAINAAYDVTKDNYNVNLLINSMLSTKEYMYSLLVYAIPVDKEVRFFDLIVAIFALISKHYRFAGNIPTSPSDISEVYRFNIEANREQIEELMDLYNATSLDPSEVLIDKPTRQLMNDVEFTTYFFEQIDVQKLLNAALKNAKTVKDYDFAKKINEFMITSKLMVDIYRKSDGEIASTYIDYLKDQSPILYDLVMTAIQSDARYVAAELADSLVQFFSDKDIQDMISVTGTTNDTLIHTYITKVVNVFKSYTVSLESAMRMTIRMWDETLNLYKILDDIEMKLSSYKYASNFIGDSISRDVEITHSDGVKIYDDITITIIK